MAFDYGQPAELFLKKRKSNARSPQVCRRFATAADALASPLKIIPHFVRSVH